MVKERMNSMYSPAEMTKNYADIGVVKAQKSWQKMFIQAIPAGFFIAAASAVANTAAFGFETESARRLVSGLIFPFGLAIVILLGTELVTGNALMSITALNRQSKWSSVFRSWLIAFWGNLAGALLLAAGNAYFGQLQWGGGGLAVFTMKVAAAKCSMPFLNAVAMGFFCNILVCAAVLCSMSSKDTGGKILGAFVPIALFVTAGYEHSVANMYYIPAGLFALHNPEYVSQALQAGVDLSRLTWSNFFLGNILPVTLGNLLGGFCLGWVMWYGFLKTSHARLGEVRPFPRTNKKA